MTRPIASTANPPAPPGYRVEAPRVSDAIGKALRGAYESDLSFDLPDDMAAMLHQLNNYQGSHAR